MNCDQAKPLLQAYADGELDAARILELESHLRACSACARATENLRSLKGALKQDTLYFAAPAELRRQIKNDLRAQFGERPGFRSWFTATTATLAVACLALLLMLAETRPSTQQRIEQEVVSSHVRSLMANHVYDVASSDQHTVKPWFDGKLDFAPPVKDLVEFPLAGGRLDYIGDRAVAALVFQRHKHVINLFIWPAKETDALPTVLKPVNGYNVVHWTTGGMTFWAVSDLNAQELAGFAQAFEKD